MVALSLDLPYDILDYPEADAYPASHALDRWQTPNPTGPGGDRSDLRQQSGGRLPVAIGDLYRYGHGLCYN